MHLFHLHIGKEPTGTYRVSSSRHELSEADDMKLECRYLSAGEAAQLVEDLVRDWFAERGEQGELF